MKTRKLLLIAVICLPLMGFGFDWGGLKDKVEEKAAEGGAGSFDIKALAGQLDGVFDSASPTVKGAIDGIVDAYTDGKDLGIFKHLETIRGAKLTPEQTSVWNRAKTDIMAAVLQRNFSFENVRASETVTSALNALRAGDLTALSQSYAQLKSSVNLSSEQKQLFEGIQENAAPIKNKAVKGIKNLFGN